MSAPRREPNVLIRFGQVIPGLPPAFLERLLHSPPRLLIGFVLAPEARAFRMDNDHFEKLRLFPRGSAPDAGEGEFDLPPVQRLSYQTGVELRSVDPLFPFAPAASFRRPGHRQVRDKGYAVRSHGEKHRNPAAFPRQGRAPLWFMRRDRNGASRRPVFGADRFITIFGKILLPPKARPGVFLRDSE